MHIACVHLKQHQNISQLVFFRLNSLAEVNTHVNSQDMEFVCETFSYRICKKTLKHIGHTSLNEGEYLVSYENALHTRVRNQSDLTPRYSAKGLLRVFCFWPAIPDGLHKDKVQSHSWLAVGAVNVGVPNGSLGRHGM